MERYRINESVGISYEHRIGEVIEAIEVGDVFGNGNLWLKGWFASGYTAHFMVKELDRIDPPITETHEV